MQKPILLHFLSREIREITPQRLSDEFIERVLFVSLFMAQELYSELTLELESLADIPMTISYLKKLNELDIVSAISCSYSLDELIVSRREMYKFDRSRYPFYYRDTSALFFPKNSFYIKSSTTKYIEKSLRKKHLNFTRVGECQNSKDLVDCIITSRLLSLPGQALTIRSFDKVLDKVQSEGVDSTSINASRSAIERELFILHTKKYLDATNSSIIKCIPYISVYDEMDSDSSYDYRVYYSILQPIIEKRNIRYLEEKLIDWRSDPAFNELIRKLFSICCYLQQLVISNYPNVEKQFVSRYVVNYITEKRKDIDNEYDFSSIEEIHRYLTVLEKKLFGSNSFAIYKNDLSISNKIKNKVLLTVSRLSDLKIALEIAESYGLTIYRQVIGSNTVYKYDGEDIQLNIVKCESESSGSSGLDFTLSDIINHIDVDTIIMIGTANYSSYDNHDSNVGDILVSIKVWGYETGKLDDKFIPRGDKISATPWLLDRFETSSIMWNETGVRFGLLASGEKQVHSRAFLLQLLEYEPEIQAVERGGLGVVSAAERYKKSWIIVKGLMDLEHKNGSEDEYIITYRTTHYVFETILKYFS